MKALEKDVFTVNLNGNVEYNVDGILTKLLDKTIFNYPHLEDYQTFLDPKNYKFSLFYSALDGLITYGTEKDGWFNAAYSRLLGKEPYNAKIDLLFWDEFLFLEYEGLIRYDSVEICKKKGVGFEPVYIPYTKKLRELNDKTGIFS